MNKVLFVSSEAYPLIKTGGLADVAGSLPRALIKQGLDVRLLLPAYPAVMEKVSNPKLINEQVHYGQTVQLLETRLPGTRVTVWLVNCPAAFDRPGTPYLDDNGDEWSDNAFRFALFSQVATNIALDYCQLSWQPDVVHCNDWQSALVPALLSIHKKRPATIFTIHNLSYQGVFNKQTFSDLHLPQQLWTLHSLEFHNQVSFIKGGLVHADRITSVSPTYAKEIQTPEFGYGLNELLNHRKDKLSGIINVWTKRPIIKPTSKQSWAYQRPRAYLCLAWLGDWLSKRVWTLSSMHCWHCYSCPCRSSYLARVNNILKLN